MSVKFLFRTSFVALLLAGVVLAGVGSDVVSTEASAASGGLSVSGVAVAPRVVSAAAGDGFAQVTIADMSPDTGVYAVQWVSAGQGFNSYQMYRTTSKTMTVPYLACTRSYTLRVFVMAADWLLADGHQTQNVTPHSQTFDLTMPACVSTATGVTALTCATGGSCIVGDTGPGGGIVFYVSAANFTSTGSDCDTTCKYLEAAPANWLTGTIGDPLRAWASGSPVKNTLLASGAVRTGIGSGFQNSLDIVAQAGNVAATSAAVEARAYQGNSKTDWHLPSKDELNQMCKWQNGVALTPEATGCALGTLNSGAGAAGFASSRYWSSSEGSASTACDQDFGFGNLFCNSKEHARFIRPVRAFG